MIGPMKSGLVLLIVTTVGLLAGGLISSCASTTGQGAVGVERRQLLLVSAEQIESMSVEGYEGMKREAQQKGTLNRDPAMLKRVTDITRKLIPHTRVFRSDAPSWKWEIHVIQEDQINAFCMPGGKMMIYSGIIEKLRLTDGELAAIIGHEMAHALREHGRERVSEQMLQQGGLQVLVQTGKLDPRYAEAAMGVSNLLISMPHGRKQESEADRIGVELMARGGFDPREALSLWKKMGGASGGKPPEFLSTHPSDERRLRDIESLLPSVMPLYGM